MMKAKGYALYKGDWLTPEALAAAKEEESRVRQARIEAARLREQIRLERERNRRIQLEMEYQRQQAYLSMIAARMYYPGCAYYRGVYGYWTFPGGSWVFVRIQAPHHGHHR